MNLEIQSLSGKGILWITSWTPFSSHSMQFTSPFLLSKMEAALILQGLYKMKRS